MDTKQITNLIASAGLFAIAFLAIPTASRAQSPSPSPSPGTSEISVNSSVEIGVRGLNVNGDHEKYRSDLNYGPGWRLFDSSFSIEDNRIGAEKAFDSAFFSASGWGGDPSGSFRLKMDKTSFYKLDANVRRVRYFNNLKNFAYNWAQVGPRGSQHTSNTLHHFGDFDAVIFPERALRFRVGYSFNNTDGPGSYNVRFPQLSSPTLTLRGDEFQVNSTIKSASHDFRAGVEGTLWGFNLGLNYGHRTFRDKTQFFVDTFNPGNNPDPTSATINTFTYFYPTKGNTDYFNFFVQRTFAERFDLTGRMIYSESKSVFDQNSIGNGTSSQAGSIPRIFLDVDQVSVRGDAKRPQARGDVGLTYRITDNFRLSNTFTFDQYSISGTNQLLENITGRSLTGTPVSAIDNDLSWRATSYRRFSNTIEGDYQVGRWLGFNIGYRYTDRRVFLDARDRNGFNLSSTFLEDEEFSNRTNTLLLGAKIKPTKNWSIFADLERGQADNIFTRLANNDFVNFRVRSIANIDKFSLNLSFVTKDNDNPGRSTPQANLPEFLATANQKSRIFSASVDWNANDNFGISGGYSYTKQDSSIDIIVPVGSPLFTSTRFLQGLSQYLLRENYFHFDLNARPIKRVSLFASYRISDDNGQGDRVAARPQDIISSYPMSFQSPEIKLGIRLTRNIDWNLGYQYYDYKETVIRDPFAFVVIPGRPNVNQIIPAQNYSAHLPYMSLRIYFGNRAGDR